ncbi:MAG: isoprenyl transferase [Bacteroidota bacterium]
MASQPSDTALFSDEQVQHALKARGPVPKHIAIIMDGNGRWAKSQGQMRVKGHYEGVESVRDIAEAAAQLGISHLTLYTFSMENWHRPSAEVTALMELLVRSLRREVATLNKNDIALRAIGNTSMLPRRAQAELDEAIAQTSGNTRMTLALALSYSGRWEIVNAARQLAQQAQAGTLNPEAIDDSMFGAHLSTHGMPDPDLLIRTGGELRVSNFLLWQIAYAEIYVTDTFWPAFRREALYDAIRNYQNRDRRFGRVDDQG